MKALTFIFLALSVTNAAAASFDCRKASTYVEKTICSDATLSKLDSVLAENYKGMLESDFGNTKQSLRASQLRWLATRNTCTTSKCILEAYRKRVDETCDYGVVSGTHPTCTMADDVIPNEQAANDKVQPRVTSEPNIAAQAAPTPNSQPAKLNAQQLVAKHARAIADLRIDPKLLKGTIYIQLDMANQPQRLATFEAWLAGIFESGRYTRVSPISAGTSKGVLLKRPGVPSSGFLFQIDDGDLFPSHYVQGDEATKIAEPNEMLLVSMGIVKALNPD